MLRWLTSIKELNEGLIHAFWEGWTERELSPLPVQGGAQLLQLPKEEQGYKAPVAYRGTILQSMKFTSLFYYYCHYNIGKGIFYCKHTYIYISYLFSTLSALRASNALHPLPNSSFVPK